MSPIRLSSAGAKGTPAGCLAMAVRALVCSKVSRCSNAVSCTINSLTVVLLSLVVDTIRDCVDAGTPAVSEDGGSKKAAMVSKSSS